jgi:hypothetical protein
MTEQKTWIVEWFLQTNLIVTVQHRFKNQYKCKETSARNTVKTLVEQFYATGNMAGKRRGGSKPRFHTPDTVRTIHASVASSPAWKFVWQPQKMRYRLRQHGAYFEPIYACIHTRSMSFSLWQLCAEKSGQGLRRNSVITCSGTHTLRNTFGFKSVWLRHLGLSEGQSVQQCAPNWRRGSRKVVHRSQEECSPVLYRTLYYVFKRFESPKGITSSMSSTTLPICEILTLVCYFDTVFI